MKRVMLDRGRGLPLWVHVCEDEDQDGEPHPIAMEKRRAALDSYWKHRLELADRERQNSNASSWSHVSRGSSCYSRPSLTSSHSTFSSISMGDLTEPSSPTSEDPDLSPLLDAFPSVPTRVPSGHPTLVFKDPFAPPSRRATPSSPHHQEYRRLNLCPDLDRRDSGIQLESQRSARPNIVAPRPQSIVHTRVSEFERPLTPLPSTPRSYQSRAASRHSMGPLAVRAPSDPATTTRRHSYVTSRVSTAPKTPTARVADAKGRLISRVSMQASQYTECEAVALETCVMMLEQTGFGMRNSALPERKSSLSSASTRGDSVQLIALMSQFLTVMTAAMQSGGTAESNVR